MQGDFVNAEEYHRHALLAAEEAGAGLEVATTLEELGLLAYFRGDFSRYVEYSRRGLAIREKFERDGFGEVASLLSLSLAAQLNGDLAKEEDYLRQAVTIRRKLAPGSLDDTPGLLNKLAWVTWQRGNLGEAQDYLRQELTIVEKVSPDSPQHANCLRYMGMLAEHSRDLDGAENYYARSLAIYERLWPGSLPLATLLEDLGRVATMRGDLTKAEERYQQVLEIQERLSPGSWLHAETLHALGVVLRGKREMEAARHYFERSVDALESQTVRLGGTEDTRSSFSARYAVYYGDLQDVLIGQKQPERAYQIKERSRARSLLQMLAERDLLFAADLPADLRLSRRHNVAEYDRVQAQIAAMNPSANKDHIAKLVGRLRELATEREQISNQIKKASPRFASLQYPQPLDLAATRQVLDPGTTLLSYAVGEDRTVLFIVQPEGSDPGLSVLTLPAKERDLQVEVQQFRRLIEEHNQGNDGVLTAQAQRLYDLLVKSAESLIAASKRLLIVPDGPLQVLPFAALRRNGREYLVEWKPLHTVVSATVYDQVKKLRHPAEVKPLQLVAFGDPQTGRTRKEGVERADDPELRFVSERGFSFGRLPFSRREVQAIAALYPNRSKTYLGAEATEEHAKALGKDVRYIHFATHGLLDEQFPLNSALVLTIPDNVAEGKDNDLLQAWEIFEQVRLDADLVTLSACNTGLGQELRGEGLIGLTRAFQYAGAQSILATLWNVDDVWTMRLMKRFYAELRKGEAKDEALRSAQLELAHSHAASAPYYWAGFSLSGDWR